MFRSANMARLTKFNSATSSELIDIIDNKIKSNIIEKRNSIKQRKIAPSSFRCLRANWFRLRGSEPDPLDNPDTTSQFTADVGTACHEMIQNILTSVEGVWVEVPNYLLSHPDVLPGCKVEKAGNEYRISAESIPVAFACDGIVKINDKIYLLEIKTSEYSSFDELMEPKSEHIDQIKMYSTLLNIPDVLVLYVDRQYGEKKCYEVHVSQSEMDEVMSRIDYLMKMVDANIAPERLETGNKYCNSNMCPYYKKCKEWG